VAVPKVRSAPLFLRRRSPIDSLSWECWAACSGWGAQIAPIRGFPTFSLIQQKQRQPDSARCGSRFTCRVFLTGDRDPIRIAVFLILTSCISKTEIAGNLRRRLRTGGKWQWAMAG
jgi:hypothetical protein